MAHGITTIRGVPAANVNWTLRQKKRSAKNEIVAPRIIAFHTMGSGEDWKGGPVKTPQQAREWVRWAKTKDVEGLKLFNHPPEVLKAGIDEAHKNGMGSVAHIAQIMVGETNAIELARLGLDNMTHFYGLFEALYKKEEIQHWPPNFNYNDEQDRFSQVAYQWNKIHERGSHEWNALIDEFLELNIWRIEN